MTEAEFTAVYRAQADKVIAGIYRIVHNESVAEELMQETFLQFLKISSGEKINSVKGLLFQISHNLAVDFVRRDRKMLSGVENKSAISKSFDQNEMDTRTLRHAITTRLAAEDPNLLKYYILKIDYDLGADEIATELKISRRSVFRLRDQVKSLLAEFL